jgi:hypothetical protein
VVQLRDSPVVLHGLVQGLLRLGFLVDEEESVEEGHVQVEFGVGVEQDDARDLQDGDQSAQEGQKVFERLDLPLDVQLLALEPQVQLEELPVQGVVGQSGDDLVLGKANVRVLNDVGHREEADVRAHIHRLQEMVDGHLRVVGHESVVGLVRERVKGLVGLFIPDCSVLVHHIELQEAPCRGGLGLDLLLHVRLAGAARAGLD